MESKKFYSAIDLQAEMLKAAMPVMTANYSDILYDFADVEELTKSKYDSHFYWTVWSKGTKVHKMCSEMDEYKKTCKHEVLISALIGKNTKEGTYEIVYA